MKTNIFEEKNINKAVLKIGLPAMLAQLATLIYNLADTYFVSLTHDSAQIAAVTLCTPVLLIIMSIACIFGIGGSSLISRLIGGGYEESSPLSQLLYLCHDCERSSNSRAWYDFCKSDCPHYWS